MNQIMADAQDDPQDFQDVAIDDNFNENRMAHLSDIIAQAMLKYSVKDYDTAAELYSQATELQAEINGEMSPQNADLLYAYGRCLYHVAVKKSDVLGSKVAGESQEGRKKSSKKLKSERASGTRDGHELRGAEETVSKVVKEKDELVKPEEESEKSNKPYFQFTGDENWDSSEEEDHSNSGEEDGEEIDEEDDFINAYEVLDLARVLLLKKLEDVKGTPSKGAGVSQGTRQLEERLADTYDLQAEISLEGERFSNAVVDLKAALRLKSVLFPQESSLLAEAHYKLSLALEFSSVTQPKESNGTTETGKDAQIDEDMRREATSEMEAAIASCTLRIQKEESVVSEAALGFGDNAKIEVTKSDIAEVKEMVKEMEQRVSVYTISKMLCFADEPKAG